MLTDWFERLLKNKHTAELLRGGLYAAVFKALSLLSGLLITALIGRYFGLSAFGYFSLIAAAWSIGSFAGKLGMDSASLKLLSRYRSNEKAGEMRLIMKQAIRMVWLTSAIAALMLFLSADWIAAYLLKDAMLTELVRYSAWVIVPLSVSSIWQNGLRAMKKVRSYTFITFSSVNIILLLLLLLSISFSTDAYAPVRLHAIAILLVSVVSYYVWTRNTERGISDEHAPHKKDLLKLAVPVFLSGLFAVINQYMPMFVLAYFTDSTEVGLLEAANRLSKMIISGFFLVSTLAGVKFVELLEQGKKEELQHMLRQKSWLIGGVAIACFIPLACFPAFFLEMLDPAFGRASLSLRILCTGQLVSALSGMVGVFMIMAGYEKTLLRIYFSGSVLTCICCVFLVPSLGLTGAAISKAACVVWVNLLCVLFIFRTTGLQFFISPYKKKEGR